ncbi:MAG: fructose-bisphosphatase class II [Phycisphaerae bacterium]|nr:fructose-bisphosphatase class II [Phycisphaerae bacterium]
MAAKKKVKKKAKATQKKKKAMIDKEIAPIDLERMVELDFVRTTEAAALNTFRYFGKGDAVGAHAAAVDAMRGTLDLTSVKGAVFCGDGLKPQPSGIDVGEKLGNCREGALEVDMALLPIDGVALVDRGLDGAMSILAAACHDDRGPVFLDVPCRYMEKIAFGPQVKAGPAQVHPNASVRDNLEIIANKLNKRVQDLKVAVLDRKRHEKLIADIRKAGASVCLINEGDVAASIAPSLASSSFDVYMGIGGAAETVLAAAAVKCLGGDILARPAPVDEQETKRVIKALGEDALEKHFCAEDMVRGDSVIFCATGISNTEVVKGIHVEGRVASTYSVVMRARYGTVRYIKATHDLSKKTVRLRSAGAERKL